MRKRLLAQDGWGVITAMFVMAIIIGIGLALFTVVDGQTRQSAIERSGESTFEYDEGLLGSAAYLLGARSTGWPQSSANGVPDCTYNGAVITATGGTGSTSDCVAPTQLAATFGSASYGGVITWSTRVRDNGGSDKCAVTGLNQCSYFYDDTASASQPAYDANNDGQVWVRAQTLFRGQRRTTVERVQLDKQTVNFPAAVITAGKLKLKDASPHIKINTQFSPINLRCAINTTGCLDVKETNKKKQISPYKISYSYPNATAIPPSTISQLRERAKKEGWWYSSCPTSPPGTQVFVESGNCTGASLPSTSPTQQGTYIQYNGTLTISGKLPTSPNLPKGRKGNYWGLIYLCNSSGSTSTDVFKIKDGRRLIRGVIAVDGPGGVNIGGSKDTLIQYDPFAIQGLYLYQGSTLVRPSFRLLNGT